MESKAENKIITFTPGLENTPGWVSLGREKQDWLLEHTSNIVNFRKMEGLGAIGACLELAQVERALEGSPMSMASYIKTVFGQSERTAYRRLKDFKELKWSPEIIARVAANGAALLKGASGIQLKTLVNVSRILPEPRSREDKVIDAWIEKDVRQEIRDIKARSRAGQTPKLNEEESARVAFNSVNRILKNLPLTTSAEKRKWLTRVCGWLMEAHAVSGTLRAGRISIPPGMVARVGRPRKILKRGGGGGAREVPKCSTRKRAA